MLRRLAATPTPVCSTPKIGVSDHVPDAFNVMLVTARLRVASARHVSANNTSPESSPFACQGEASVCHPLIKGVFKKQKTGIAGSSPVGRPNLMARHQEFLRRCRQRRLAIRWLRLKV